MVYYVFKKNELVYKINLPLSLNEEEKIYLKIPQYDEKWYDIGALIYFMWQGLLYKLFQRPIAKTNMFGHTDQFLCTEIANIIDPTLQNLDITRPYNVYLYFKEKYGDTVLY